MTSSAINPTTQLQKVNSTDNAEILLTANAALLLSRNNISALHTKIVALIRLDRFEDALRALKDGGEKILSRCVLENAYALYKTGRLIDADLLLQNTENRGLKHVAAQVAYRAGRFSIAASHYKDLCKENAPIEGEDIDLKVNVSAITAQLEWQGKDDIQQGKDCFSTDDLNLFEISYNAACRCVAGNDFETADTLLNKARGLCQSSDELSDEEKKSEMLPIMIQQIYVLMKLRRHEEAQNLLKLIIIEDVLEPPTKTIAYNNSTVFLKVENPFLLRRSLDSILNLDSRHTEEYFWYQSNILQRNKLILDIKTQKHFGVARSTERILSESSPTLCPHVNLISVLNAAAHSKKNVKKSELNTVLPLLGKRPKDVGLILTFIQICAQANNLSLAISRLENFFSLLENSAVTVDQEVRFAPGLIALLVSLHRLLGRKTPIKLALAKAVSYWRSRNRTIIPITQAAGISLLESKDSDDLSDANKIFKSMRDENPEDLIAIAGYVASCSTTKLETLSSDLDKLSPVSLLISGIDISALEDAGIPCFTECVTKPCKENSMGTEKTLAKKRTTSKKRMPKNFEKGKVMDPERWLSARDRSDYRSSIKKSKKKIKDLTQGGAAQDNEESGMANPVSVAKPEKIVPAKAKRKKGKK